MNPSNTVTENGFAIDLVDLGHALGHQVDEDGHCMRCCDGHFLPISHARNTGRNFYRRAIRSGHAPKDILELAEKSTENYHHSHGDEVPR